jgi:hypothetical protein
MTGQTKGDLLMQVAALKLALNTIVHNPSHLNALKIKIDHNI